MTTTAAPLTDIFSPELRPVLRRLGERPLSAESAAAQGAVWAALAQAGALRDVHAVLPVAELLGEALYRGPCLDTVAAVEALASLPGPSGADPVLDEMRRGGLAAALAGPDRRFVRCADQADLLFTVDGARLTVVELDHPGVRLREHADLGRGGLFAVDVEAGVPLVLSGRLPDPQDLTDRIRSRQAAYLAGLSRGALDLATAHARRRTVFGKPLGAHQSPAFRLAALSARLEAVRSLVHRQDAPGSALRLARELAVDAAAETLQLHGASGLLDEDDAQLFYRRALTESALCR
ncbi:acyl-CoA dehydrogenase family protein [Streptomyces albogriseolus]|uniref:acyl-CoA dehydrogenase family protein n=1 Tax=Streptomyces albogriseolus TaxID=1887 RepID=UPI0037A805DA